MVTFSSFAVQAGIGIALAVATIWALNNPTKVVTAWNKVIRR